MCSCLLARVLVARLPRPRLPRAPWLLPTHCSSTCTAVSSSPTTQPPSAHMPVRTRERGMCEARHRCARDTISARTTLRSARHSPPHARIQSLHAGRAQLRQRRNVHRHRPSSVRP